MEHLFHSIGTNASWRPYLLAMELLLPLQAAAAYASIINGGVSVTPTLQKNKNINKIQDRIISLETSKKIRQILRKVVTDEKGTARFADIFGYNVSGKTGTSQYYKHKNKNINTFISFFTAANEKYVLLVMLDDPQKRQN